MIAVDTNVLVQASRDDMPSHEPAKERLRSLAEGRHRWAIPWQCVAEFVAVVTNPRVFAIATPTQQAVDQMAAWLESPSTVAIAENERFWPEYARLLATDGVRGARAHDARIAAICLAHGIDELWTADRDFSRFPGLRVRNPLIP